MKSYTSVAFGSRVPGTFEVEHLEEKVKSELFFFISVPFCSQKSAKNEVAILLTTKELRGNWLLKLVDKRKLCAHFPTDTAPHFKETITIPTGFVDCCYKIRCDKSRVICNNFKLPNYTTLYWELPACYTMMPIQLRYFQLTQFVCGAYILAQELSTQQVSLTSHVIHMFYRSFLVLLTWFILY